jgi:ribA/ribD-fused uncharacterized protein
MTNYRFFWGIKDPESNFYPTKFTYKNLEFNCSEQAYMWEKAMYFDDLESARKIHLLQRPGEQKKAGRLVKNFDPAIWGEVKTQYMYQVCMQKFSKEFNPYLHDYLLGTGNAILVEASPFDKEWGIGLDAVEASSIPYDLWPGKNLLGKVLMCVREDLSYKYFADNSIRKIKYTYAK